MTEVHRVLRSLHDILGVASVATLSAPHVMHTPFLTQAGTAKNTGLSLP